MTMAIRSYHWTVEFDWPPPVTLLDVTWGAQERIGRPAGDRVGDPNRGRVFRGRAQAIRAASCRAATPTRASGDTILLLVAEAPNKREPL
jgi:hypothetical protein